MVVAEKATSLRGGGKNVDVNGAGQQVIKFMGLADQVEARNIRECGQKWRHAAGKVVAVFLKSVRQPEQ